MVPVSNYIQGSCFHVNNAAQNIVLTLTTNTFGNCYRAYQGGAIYVTTTGTKTLSLSGNTFSKNVAIYGGAIYCDKCNWATMYNNVF